MPYDAAVMHRASGGANLTTTETGTGFLIDGTPLAGMYVRCVVPQATGTTPTMDLVIQASDVIGSGYTASTTFDQITAAGVYWRRFATKKKFTRHVATIGGTTPNFGAVSIGFSTGPEYLG